VIGIGMVFTCICDGGRQRRRSGASGVTISGAECSVDECGRSFEFHELTTCLGSAQQLPRSLQDLAPLAVAVDLDQPLDARKAFGGGHFVSWHDWMSVLDRGIANCP
jgi:hypothetical protein